jgi:hypothetical protein
VIWRVQRDGEGRKKVEQGVVYRRGDRSDGERLEISEEKEIPSHVGRL